MNSRRRKILTALVFLLLILLLICCICCHLKAALPPRWQPAVGVSQGVDVVALEDFVAFQDGRYVVAATALGQFTQIPLWGGWSVSANITYSTLVINLKDAGGPDAYVLIFGVASRSASLDQDLGHGFRVHASGEGGYVVYNDTLAGWCLRPAAYDQGAYVWLPASTCSLNVKYMITVEPAHGAVFVNGKLSSVYSVKLVKVSGILPGWAVFANKTGVYYLTVRP